MALKRLLAAAGSNVCSLTTAWMQDGAGQVVLVPFEAQWQRALNHSKLQKLAAAVPTHVSSTRQASDGTARYASRMETSRGRRPAASHASSSLAAGRPCSALEVIDNQYLKAPQSVQAQLRLLRITSVAIS